MNHETNMIDMITSCHNTSYDNQDDLEATEGDWRHEKAPEGHLDSQEAIREVQDQNAIQTSPLSGLSCIERVRDHHPKALWAYR